MIELTTRAIQRAILIDYWQRNTTLPNFTPAGWFECDVFVLSDCDYFSEFEIKTSRSDFKADANKAPTFDLIQEGQWVTQKGESKHSRLQRADPTGPRRFYFVTPENLVQPPEVPHWAGLIYARPSNYRAYLQIIRPAPFLHKAKSPQHRPDVHTAAYYRHLRNLVSPP